ncbi:MAG TPA: hypothetical protein VFY97_10430 [Rhodanobacteraceae bacterium]|nr:hypothetical protein [Rhodanobacteraceae bacterium]
MTLDSERGFASGTRTTAAGLEAWLSGAHAGSAEDTSAPVKAPEAVVPMEPLAEPGVIGPVNAAEALALGMATTPRKLTGPDGAELIIDPEHNAYHFESTLLKPLLAILQQPPKRWEPVYSEALNAARAADPAQPLERLHWFAGLVATPGILGRRLDRGERYKLTGWPETEREFPKHFRIAKAMLKEAATVDEIAAASGMPYEDVVDYMNASHAAGRLEAASAGRETAAAPTASRRGRIMATLNKPLFAR